jgi:hypothetical protein
MRLEAREFHNIFAVANGIFSAIVLLVLSSSRPRDGTNNCGAQLQRQAYG